MGTFFGISVNVIISITRKIIYIYVKVLIFKILYCAGYFELSEKQMSRTGIIWLNPFIFI